MLSGSLDQCSLMCPLSPCFEASSNQLLTPPVNSFMEPEVTEDDNEWQLWNISICRDIARGGQLWPEPHQSQPRGTYVSFEKVNILGVRTLVPT